MTNFGYEKHKIETLQPPIIAEDAEGALPTTAVSPTRVSTAMPGIYLRG